MTSRIKRGIRVRAGASIGALALALLASPALAQQTASNDPAPAPVPNGQAAGDPANGGQAAATDQPVADSQAPDIIVTGTAGGRGVNRMSAAFAVTNISSGDLLKSAPKSSAEVLTLVPGVWVESSGGVAGANITVRGLPSAGDAPFGGQAPGVEEPRRRQPGRQAGGGRQEQGHRQGSRSRSTRSSSDSTVPLSAENSSPSFASTCTWPGASAMRPSTPWRWKCRVSPSQR